MVKPLCPEPWIESFSAKLKAIGHPLRLKLLMLIAQKHPCVSDLWQCVGESQPVVSQHLAILKEKGIVESHPEGTRRVYEIADDEIRQMIKTIYSLIPEEDE